MSKSCLQAFENKDQENMKALEERRRKAAAGRGKGGKKVC